MRRIARAKINLCLHVVGRRPDGYHLLDGLTTFAALGDHVSLERTGSGAFLQVSCRDLPPGSEVVPTDTGNLAWRALAAVHRDALAQGTRPEVPNGSLTLSIEKIIPSGAGLGGGSADAAAALNLVNDALGRPVGPTQLAEIGLTLGADVPVCLAGSCRRVQGIGDVLSPALTLPPLPAVLIWPGAPVSTPKVFSRRGGGFDRALTEAELNRVLSDPIAGLAALHNGLTEAAISLEPRIADALKALENLKTCRLARMSGSGSAVFGLFETGGEADAAADRLRAAQPDWWVRATRLGG
ncbi:MAG: 4-(cytidine 5'-diphospho)-2-C-methyl-D-erythritol kinase [Alphaproteobacteria bacterium]|nr:4-(cytidine 5'-diphospho)-2-C-methyl-D-erythritol kinase [Alphaproteobacteria bacterium]